METDGELSGEDESRTDRNQIRNLEFEIREKEYSAPASAEGGGRDLSDGPTDVESASSKAQPRTDSEVERPAADENVTREPTEEPAEAQRREFTDIRAKVKLLVKLALENLDEC
jgi:hypothetical protein